MTGNNPNINQILEKLEVLLKRQNDFSREINNLRIEIHRLKNSGSEQTAVEQELTQDNPAALAEAEIKKENIFTKSETRQQQQE